MVSQQLSPRLPAHAAQQRLTLSLGLVGAIWLAGLIGHFTVVAEWPALFLYVLGSIGLTLWYCRRFDAWRNVYISKQNLGKALRWGGLIGGVLMLLDVVNTYFYYRSGGAPMAQMEQLLVGMRLLYLFPVLILAEEFLWRGMLFSALLERGVNKHLVVIITMLLYTLNHYAVAPVGFTERSLMAMMAIPLGVVNGYLALRYKNLWGGVLLHMLTMISMTADIFLIPLLV